ncbi:Abi family protein [Wielerella bovis]|uniref:Abi family protein n=1 Tax=Wielerella bovis TaxID=2917790 RepID=UPI002018DA88|nr:Abi family protein [Wielerella bovis]ULJ60330.1 Abi family protein [Wielerella bovis]
MLLPQPKSQTSTRSDYFVDNTEFHHVVQLYDFDNAIKLLALEAIQHIEIAMRTQIAYTLGKYNPLAHLDCLYFKQSFKHEDWLSRYYTTVVRELDNDRKSQIHKGFALHNKETYGTLPIWVACEIWDFGAMSKLYAQMKPHDKQTIEHEFNLFNDELSGHLKAFNFVRNIAAHHGRLWNKHLINRPRISPLIDANNPQWQKLNNQNCRNHVFVIFCLMQCMLKVICPMSDWGVRFQAALKKFPNHSANTMEISLDKMGMGGLSLTDLSNWDLWK